MKITAFLLASYLVIASLYTFESVMSNDKNNKYWYLAPFVLLGCLFFCWIYFPYDIGPKLYKKLNDEEKEENKINKICSNCKFQLSDKCPNKERRSHNYTCEKFTLAWYLKSN